jgi:hypothetical protein
MNNPLTIAAQSLSNRFAIPSQSLRHRFAMAPQSLCICFTFARKCNADCLDDHALSTVRFTGQSLSDRCAIALRSLHNRCAIALRSLHNRYAFAFHSLANVMLIALMIAALQVLSLCVSLCNHISVAVQSLC